MVRKPSFGCLVQIRGQGYLQGRKSGGVLLREIAEMAAVFEISLLLWSHWTCLLPWMQRSSLVCF